MTKSHTRIASICFLTFILALVASCNKKVDSDFALKQYEYGPGDQLDIELFSEKQSSCLWEVVDSDGTVIQSSEDNHPSIILGILSDSGPYSLRLTTFNNNKKKKSVSEKPFLIKAEKVLFSVNYNTSPGSENNFKVYIDNQYIGKSTPYNSNQYGIFQKYIPTGKRLIRLVSDNDEYEEVIDVTGSFAISF